MTPPSIPLELELNAVFPYPEGNMLEFKQNNAAKMADTLCGFLNARGGHYIIGVRDDGVMTGIKRSALDTHMRVVDAILAHGTIADTISKTPVTSAQIACSTVRLVGRTEMFLLVITATPVADSAVIWQVPDAVVYRLNASNRRVPVTTTTPAVEIQELKAKLAAAESTVLSLVLEAKMREAVIETERAAATVALTGATKMCEKKAAELAGAVKMCDKKAAELAGKTLAHDAAIALLHSAILESKAKAEKLLALEARGFFERLFCC